MGDGVQTVPCEFPSLVGLHHSDQWGKDTGTAVVRAPGVSAGAPLKLNDIEVALPVLGKVSLVGLYVSISKAGEPVVRITFSYPGDTPLPEGWDYGEDGNCRYSEVGVSGAFGGQDGPRLVSITLPIAELWILGARKGVKEE